MPFLFKQLPCPCQQETSTLKLLKENDILNCSKPLLVKCLQHNQLNESCITRVYTTVVEAQTPFVKPSLSNQNTMELERAKPHGHCHQPQLLSLLQTICFQGDELTFSNFVESFKTLFTSDSCSFLFGFFSIFRYKFICDINITDEINIPTLAPKQFLALEKLVIFAISLLKW